MARPDKVAVVERVRERLEGSTATVLTEYRGLTVTQLAQLRAELRKAGADYKVVKNTLTKLAADAAGYDVPAELLTGPTAVTFVADDPVAAAKVLRTFSRANPDLVIKGGILEGRVIDAAETLSLADLASREELLATLAGMMQSIIAQPARLAVANLSKAARLFAALMDKRREAGEVMEAVDPEPDSPAAQAAVAEARADDDVNATPGDTGPEGPAANTAPETAPEAAAEPTGGDEAAPDATAEAGLGGAPAPDADSTATDGADEAEPTT